MNYKKVYIILLKENNLINGYLNDCYDDKTRAEEVAIEMGKLHGFNAEVKELILNSAD